MPRLVLVSCNDISLKNELFSNSQQQVILRAACGKIIQTEAFITVKYYYNLLVSIDKQKTNSVGVEAVWLHCFQPWLEAKAAALVFSGLHVRA